MSSHRSRVLKRLIVADVGGEVLSAVQLDVKRNAVVLQRHLSVPIPESVDIAVPSAVGRWMGQVLTEYGFDRLPLVLTAARGAVGLKRLELPPCSPDELPPMVAIRMSGQLPFDASSAVIDYAVLGAAHEAAEGRQAVIAAGIPEAVVDRYREIADASGYKLARIALRPLATAALCSDRARAIESGGALLAVDVRDTGSVEVVVEYGSGMRFARGVDLRIIDEADPTDREQLVRRIAIEVQRSWMSYRVTEDSPDVECVIITGPDELAAGVARQVQTTLERQADVLQSSTAVEGNTEGVGSCWPLIGVGIQYLEGRDFIDFLHPKQAPDHAARRRQRLLGAAGIVIVASVVAWQIGHVMLGRLSDDLAAIKQTYDELAPQRVEVIRQRLRLEHVRRWEAARIDSVSQMEHVLTLLPDPNQLILGSFSFAQESDGIGWDRRAGRWDQGAEAEPVALIQFGGVAVDRRVADGLRATLLKDAVYTLVSPIGSDGPAPSDTYDEKFGLRLMTSAKTVGDDAEREDDEATNRVIPNGESY
ncbi:MAG: hypothetical protein D8M59_02535 [Planctomycetes bacterium]|nr:hypothetical protein [Planctomycetota bacterium]NOG54403.1 hypothetical protein [Planctomycetota bacterium]